MSSYATGRSRKSRGGTPMCDIRDRPLLAPFKNYWAAQALDELRNESKSSLDVSLTSGADTSKNGSQSSVIAGGTKQDRFVPSRLGEPPMTNDSSSLSPSSLLSGSRSTSLSNSHVNASESVNRFDIGSSKEGANRKEDVTGTHNHAADSEADSRHPYNQLSRRVSLSVPNIPSIQLNGADLKDRNHSTSSRIQLTHDKKTRKYNLCANGKNKSFTSPEEAFENLTSITAAPNTGLVAASGSSTSLVTPANPTGKVSVIHTIDQLQTSLGHDIVVQVDCVEADLVTKVKMFEKTLGELISLRDICQDSMKKIELSSEETSQSVDEHFERFENLRAEFASIDQLEERMEKARTKIIEYSKRLECVQQRIEIREKSNMQRKQRKKYWQRSVLCISIVILILAIFIKSLGMR